MTRTALSSMTGVALVLSLPAVPAGASPAMVAKAKGAGYPAQSCQYWSCPGSVEGELLSKWSRHQHRGGYRDSAPGVDRRS